jgi:hypothetical protein
MHVLTLLKATMFDIEMAGQPASIADVFPDWHAHDRFGLVIDEALGGLGATHLLQVAMTLFYDVKPSRKNELTVYPEIYAFHVGKPRGAHAPYDFWPARREVILETDDHRVVLDAINDRGITRLAVPERPRREVIHRPKEEDCAFDRIASAFLYHPSGRVADPDLMIAGTDRRTEYNPDQTLKPYSEARMASFKPSSTRPVKELDTSYVDWLRLRSHDMTEDERLVAEKRRIDLRAGGLARESYRRVSVADALQHLASAGRQ